MFEKMNQALPHFTCLVCRKESDAYQISVFQNLEFLACQNCGSVTSAPIPDQEEIDEALNASRMAQFSPFPTKTEKKHYLKHMTDLRKGAKNDRCIDLKAHNGVRTETARLTAFPEIVGIDSNPFSIEIAQKRFHRGNFLNLTLKEFAQNNEDKFDTAISYHTLENTNDPDGYLEDLKKILNPKALVYFSLCDGNHFMVPHTFMKWKEVFYPNRVHYFSRDGLEIILRRQGFKIVRRYKRFLPYQHVIARLMK